MEVLVLDGKDYVKASKAAKDLGYASDYVGQLCRSGQVDAHLIGRTWYVNKDELGTHRVEKKRMARVKAREYAKRSIEEHRKESIQTKNVSRNIVIQYEHDDESLIPETKKLSIHREKENKKTRIIADEDIGDEKTILNRGEKVQMQGKIKIVDVTDGIIDTDTTVLTPTILKSSPKVKEIPNDTHKVEVVSTDEGQEVPMIAKKITFAERLDAQSTEQTIETTLDHEENQQDEMVSQEKTGSLPYVLSVGVVFMLAILTVCTIRTSTYSFNNDGTVSENHTYSISLEDTLSILQLKI